MDDKFLEFWGNLLLSAAKSQQRTDEFMRWLRMGLPGLASPSPSKTLPAGFDEMVAVFQKLYGIQEKPKNDQDMQKSWAEALEAFQKSFQDSLEFYGVVPKKDHLALVEKYEKLKARCIDQEETIRHLRMLLADQKEGTSDATGQLEDIVRNQGELFQKMMTDFSQLFSSETTPSKPEPKKKEPKEKEEKEDENDRSDKPGSND